MARRPTTNAALDCPTCQTLPTSLVYGIEGEVGVCFVVLPRRAGAALPRMRRRRGLKRRRSSRHINAADLRIRHPCAAAQAYRAAACLYVTLFSVVRRLTLLKSNSGAAFSVDIYHLSSAGMGAGDFGVATPHNLAN
jgi:hypothetical protein